MEKLFCNDMEFITYKTKFVEWKNDLWHGNKSCEIEKDMNASNEMMVSQILKLQHGRWKLKSTFFEIIECNILKMVVLTYF